MLLLTGATGSIGSRLLPLLLERGEDVRCLVREPRRLGARRVDVQIALGDLGEMSDPYLVRQALRGVDTVDPPGGDDPRPAAAPDRGAERAGDGAAAAGGRAQRRASASSSSAPSTPPRPSARASSAPSGWPSRRSTPRRCETTVFAPSIVYDHSDPWITLLRRFSFLPVLPVSGDGQGALPADLGGGRGPLRGRRAGRRRRGRATSWPGRRRSATTRCPTWSAASPAGRGRSSTCRCPLVRSGLIALRSVFGEAVFATWEEAELMEVSMISERGTADAQALGVEPRRMSDVLEEA